MLSREEFARRLEEELPDVADSVPHRWQELGDVVVIRLFDERAWAYRREVGRILREVTGARSVVALRRVSGTFREPVGEVVAGIGTRKPCTGSWESGSSWTRRG